MRGTLLSTSRGGILRFDPWKHSVRVKIIVGVMGIIYDYAKVPSYPDTGPQPTVRELFASRDPEVNPRYTHLVEVILEHYDQVLPGVEF